MNIWIVVACGWETEAILCAHRRESEAKKEVERLTSANPKGEDEYGLPVWYKIEKCELKQ